MTAEYHGKAPPGGDQGGVIFSHIAEHMEVPHDGDLVL